MVTRDQVENWISNYERSWRTPGTALLRDLFSDGACYRQAPYDAPRVGIDEIAAMWEEQRESPDEVFSMSSEILAVEGDTAVVRLRVRYGDPLTQEYLDLWVIQFDEEGRCVAFEEWPFWPEHGRSPG
jgi:hypothetical protein